MSACFREVQRETTNLMLQLWDVKDRRQQYLLLALLLKMGKQTCRLANRYSNEIIFSKYQVGEVNTTIILAKAVDDDSEVSSLNPGLVPFGWFGEALPKFFQINTTLYYDNSLLNHFDGSAARVKLWINSVLEFAKVKLNQPSLDVHLKLKVNSTCQIASWIYIYLST